MIPRPLPLLALLFVAPLSRAQAPAGVALPEPLKRAAAVFNGERKEYAFLVSMPRQEAVAAFAPIQRSRYPDSAAYVVATFGLAMNGVEVPANVGRLVGPLKRFQDGKLAELMVSSGFAEGQVLLEDIPTALYRIYQARRSTEALQALIMAPMEGAVAENRDDYVVDLLRADPIPVLKLAASPPVYARVWDIADWNIGLPQERRDFIRKLRTTPWPTPALKRTALKLASDLRVRRNRP